MVKALLLDKKSQNQSPAPVKAVEESCVTYGGAHSYRNFPATDGNVYRDNIQEFVSQAFAVNYNQGNTNYRPPMIMAECLAQEDLGASINLIPFSIWKRLAFPDLTPMCMTLELADRLISYPVRVAEDVYVKVGSFHFPTDFVVVDFDDDPPIPLIMGRSFLKTGRAQIDVFEGNYLLEVRKELKICEAKSDKSSVDEPSAVELKDLSPHLEYAFLEGDEKFPLIIAKYLSMEEKTALITVLKSHKRAIAWKLSDIKGVIKLLEAGLIYPISDSPWVSPVHCVPKKGGFTVVENEDNELIPSRLVTGWRVCIDYHKLNEATRKDHFPLLFMDQMLERLAGNQYYCFLDSFSGYFQIPIDLKDQEKTTFTCPYRTFAYRRMPFGLCNAPGMFQRKDAEEEFTFKVIYTKGAENMAADHLSRLEYPHQNMLDPEEINELFPFETLNLVSARGENRVSWSDKLDDALRAFRTAYKTPIRSGDHKKVQINELNKLRDQAYKNSLIYKEKTKRLHDSKIKNRVFNIGDKVLLFNSRLKIFFGKLKSRWSGPFTISQVYPYGTVKLSQPDGPKFKVNGHRLKHYFGEDIAKLVVPDL
nr:reverse transcriptase domain-containing protein [Tanacetum cinerariifolium]